MIQPLRTGGLGENSGQQEEGLTRDTVALLQDADSAYFSSSKKKAN